MADEPKPPAAGAAHLARAISGQADAELRATLEYFQRVAEQATGLTREELLAKQREIEAAEAARPPGQLVAIEIAKARGVPLRHIQGVVERAPIECTALELVRDFLAAEKQTILMLAGPVGLRKSGSACWALTQKPGLYIQAADLVDIAKREEYRARWMRVRRTPLLVLDELSGEYVDDKGVFVKLFNQVLQERYNACLKTILTYNGDAKTFRATYGDRAASRLAEAADFAELDGPDVRGSVEHWSNTESRREP